MRKIFRFSKAELKKVALGSLLTIPAYFAGQELFSRVVIVRSYSIDTQVAFIFDGQVRQGGLLTGMIPWGENNEPIHVIKHAACLGRQRFTVNEKGVYCDGQFLARVRRTGFMTGVALPEFRYDKVLDDDEVAIMGTHEGSFDSRYKGPVKRSLLRRAFALSTRDSG